MISTSDVDAFLAQFFAPGNELVLADLRQNSPKLAEWLDGRIASVYEHPQAVHMLPRRAADRIAWYGLAHSSRDLRQLTEALTSFVVPTYARFRPTALSSSDPIDEAVALFTDGNALVLDVVSGQQEQVRRALDILAALERERPRRQVAVRRPLGRLLREFEMALVAASAETSGALLQDIEDSGELTAQNIVFLRIRRLAGLDRFHELLELPELATVLAMRRPSLVTAKLIQAVYITEFSSLEAASDADGALKHFADAVMPRYPALFKSRQGLQTPEAIKGFMLWSLVAHPNDAGTREQLLVSPDLRDSDRRFLEELARLGGHEPLPAHSLDDAVTAVQSGDFDSALEIARVQPSSRARAEILIRCAFEIDALDAMRTAVSAVEALDPTQREELTTSRWYAVPWAHIVEELSGTSSIATVELPTSWPAWFNDVARGEPTLSNAIQVAERAVVEWSIEQFSVEDGRAVVQALTRKMAPAKARLVKDGLPYFLQFLDRIEDSARHRELLDDLTVFMLSEGDLSVADLQVTTSLVATVLEAGISTERYRQLVGDLRDWWAHVDAPVYLDAGIDLLDTLADYACPDVGVRDALLHAIVASFQRWRRKVRPDQWALVADLAGELGAGEAVAAIRPSEEQGLETSPSFGKLLNGKTVALYTLTEPAAIRARDFLMRNAEGVTVEISSEHVASDRLRTLAKVADFFIIATRSAKHAATGFIEAQRPHERPILYAAGKGSASLLRALLSELRL